MLHLPLRALSGGEVADGRGGEHVQTEEPPVLLIDRSLHGHVLDLQVCLEPEDLLLSLGDHLGVPVGPDTVEEGLHLRRAVRLT